MNLRREGLWLVTVVIAALLQSTWLRAFTVQGELPDLILLLVVYFALIDGEVRAMFTGFIGGLYQDVSNNDVLGHTILCHVLIGYAIGRMSERLITDHPAVKAFIVGCAAVAHGVLFTAIQFVQQPHQSMTYTIITQVLPGAFYTALVTPLVFFLLTWMFHRDELVERRALGR